MNYIPFILTLVLTGSSGDVVSTNMSQLDTPSTPNVVSNVIAGDLSQQQPSIAANPAMGNIELQGSNQVLNGQEPSSRLEDSTALVPNDEPTRLMTRAMQTAGDAKLAGQSVTLFSALATARGKEQQVAVVHAYWDLVAMMAQYNLRYREQTLLKTIVPQPNDEAMLRAAQASAEASLEEAAIAAVEAQHALAHQGMLPTMSGGLPLPSDRPCVGPYETRFEQIFANRPAPENAWLMARTLPMHYRVVERRAGAVKMAEEALDASRQAYAAGTVSFERVLTTLAAWMRQENAFMQSVCNYNHNIAEYVAAASVRPTDGATLVSMLIGRPLVPQPEPMVPVGNTPLTGQPTPAGALPWQRQTPTLAPPLNPVRPAEHVEPLPEANDRIPNSISTTTREIRPLDITPDLYPLEGKMVPVSPNKESASSTPWEAVDKKEAPKVQVIPVDQP